MQNENNEEESEDVRSQQIVSRQEKIIVKTDVFVIQKYIERPLLIFERKFDIRVWVLITHEHKCYLFKEGYIRTSSYKYNCEQAADDENMAVHLTNNAIQKYDSNYGK